MFARAKFTSFQLISLLNQDQENVCVRPKSATKVAKEINCSIHLKINQGMSNYFHL